jgi:hypothetical protein
VITSVASEPNAWMKSARASCMPRRSESRKPRPSTSATGTASPTKAKYASVTMSNPGRTSTRCRISGRNATRPTANAVPTFLRSTPIASPTRQAPMYASAQIAAPTTGMTVHSSTSGSSASMSATAAGPNPRASDAQKRAP